MSKGNRRWAQRRAALLGVRQQQWMHALLMDGVLFVSPRWWNRLRRGVVLPAASLMNSGVPYSLLSGIEVRKAWALPVPRREARP